MTTWMGRERIKVKNQKTPSGQDCRMQVFPKSRRGANERDFERAGVATSDGRAPSGENGKGGSTSTSGLVGGRGKTPRRPNGAKRGGGSRRPTTSFPMGRSRHGCRRRPSGLNNFKKILKKNPAMLKMGGWVGDLFFAFLVWTRCEMEVLL